MKFDMDYIAHNNELTETNPYFKLFLTIIFPLKSANATAVFVPPISIPKQYFILFTTNFK